MSESEKKADRESVRVCKWVIVADGEGAAAHLIFSDDDLHEAVHRFMCVCGKPWLKCDSPGIPADIALIDDPAQWTNDEDGQKFSINWASETGYIILYRLSEPLAEPAEPSGGPENISKIIRRVCSEWQAMVLNTESGAIPSKKRMAEIIGYVQDTIEFEINKAALAAVGNPRIGAELAEISSALSNQPIREGVGIPSNSPLSNEQPPLQSANFMQTVSGFCFAHGSWDGQRCPKWPACETDPQIYNRDKSVRNLVNIPRVGSSKRKDLAEKLNRG